MALTLEIEYLGGVCFAAQGPDSDLPDWPPQPDRIFSALVATWGAHDEPQNERDALEWLEKQLPPLWVAEDGHPRTAPEVFVPPNDPRLGKAKSAAGVLPDFRSRQPRRFPAIRPLDPVVKYVWQEEPDQAIFDALESLARDTSYVGHSSSVTRCRFVRSDAIPTDSLREPRRRVYPGRLQELSESYQRFKVSTDKKDRPRPGALVVPKSKVQERRRNVFSDQWLFLEHVGGQMPDVRAVSIVARGIRTALMSGFGQISAPVPTVVSGHESDGLPVREPHLAIIPLCFAGFPYSDGRVLGFALVPPTDSGLFDDRTFRAVLRKLAPIREMDGRRVLEVKSTHGTEQQHAFALEFSLSFEPPAARSFDPYLYTRPARRFATVTPVALDRHLKKQGEARIEEISEQIKSACERIGLPRPALVCPDKHSALEGAASAYPSGRSPKWMHWRLPDFLANRQLTHTVVEFAEPVEGPLLLGAGRFVGMGLCRPLDGER